MINQSEFGRCPLHSCELNIISVGICFVHASSPKDSCSKGCASDIKVLICLHLIA